MFYFLNVVEIFTSDLVYFCTAESGNGIRFSPSGQVFCEVGLKLIISFDKIDYIFVA